MATELVDELIAGLELAPLPSDQDRYYLERFVEFVREWAAQERRQDSFATSSNTSTTSTKPRGDICLEEDMTDDAVQLMTVHSAKGLEFPHVFILRLSKRDFPSGNAQAGV